jgi:hypothetical protein
MIDYYFLLKNIKNVNISKEEYYFNLNHFEKEGVILECWKLDTSDDPLVFTIYKPNNNFVKIFNK